MIWISEVPYWESILGKKNEKSNDFHGVGRNFIVILSCTFIRVEFIFYTLDAIWLILTLTLFYFDPFMSKVNLNYHIILSDPQFRS